MNNTPISAERAEPPGSRDSVPRKFSTSVAALLRDNRQLVEIVRQHNIALPSGARIEDIHNETTTFIRVLLSDAGDAQEVTFSLNGALLANERPFTRDNKEPGETMDVQDGLDRRDPNALRLLRLCEQHFGRIHTRVLNARPPETAIQA